MQELGLPHALTNVNGGAVALGHPLGCSGARILTTLLHEMRRRAPQEARPYYGLATLCVGVGQGEATIVEWIGDATETQEYHQGDYTVALTRPDWTGLIHDYLANRSYWVPGIPLSYVGGCPALAQLWPVPPGPADRLPALTDYVRFAYLMDVFVLEAYRGQGWKWLMACVFGIRG
jgi:hypothetical protein